MQVTTQPRAVDCLLRGNSSQTPMDMKLGGPQDVYEKKKSLAPIGNQTPYRSATTVVSI